MRSKPGESGKLAEAPGSGEPAPVAEAETQALDSDEPADAVTETEARESGKPTEAPGSGEPAPVAEAETEALDSDSPRG